MLDWGQLVTTDTKNCTVSHYNSAKNWKKHAITKSIKSEPSQERMKFKGMILGNSENNYLEQNSFVHQGRASLSLVQARLSAQDVGTMKWCR